MMSRVRSILAVALIASSAGSAAGDETSVQKAASPPRATPTSSSRAARTPTTSDEARTLEWERQRAGIGGAPAPRPPGGTPTTIDEVRALAIYLQAQIEASGTAQPTARRVHRYPTTTDEARGLD